MLAISPGAEIQFEHPIKELEQNLEANTGNGRVVAAFAKLVPYECI